MSFVTEKNFVDLVSLADNSVLMMPLRKALAKYIQRNYAYSDELSFLLKSHPNLDVGNIYAILCQVYEKENSD